MDHSRCLKILKVYGAGPKMLQRIDSFWDRSVLVCQAGGCYGRPYRVQCGVTQGGPFSPHIFNTMVDVIVCEWLRQVLGVGAMLTGIGEEIRKFLAAFYADDGLVLARCSVLL